MIDVDTFSDDQKRLLSGIVMDFGGPTSTGAVQRILESALTSWNRTGRRL